MKTVLPSNAINSNGSEFITLFLLFFPIGYHQEIIYRGVVLKINVYGRQESQHGSLSSLCNDSVTLFNAELNDNKQPTKKQINYKLGNFNIGENSFVSSLTFILYNLSTFLEGYTLHYFYVGVGGRGSQPPLLLGYVAIFDTIFFKRSARATSQHSKKHGGAALARPQPWCQVWQVRWLLASGNKRSRVSLLSLAGNGQNQVFDRNCVRTNSAREIYWNTYRYSNAVSFLHTRGNISY
jgi:hypothetical protein